jgi:hypothetical protein
MRDTMAAAQVKTDGRSNNFKKSIVAWRCGADTPLRSFVERVEKPTDNRAARLLCSHAADADSMGDRPVVGPGASPIPLPRWGQCGFGGSPKSRAVEGFRCGTRTRRNTRVPRRDIALETDVIPAKDRTQKVVCKADRAFGIP